MTAVLLNGTPSPSDPAHKLCAEVQRQLGAQLDTVRSFHLAGDVTMVFVPYGIQMIRNEAQEVLTSGVRG